MPGNTLENDYICTQARYSMGANTVGKLQYDENHMANGARLRVLVEDGDFYLKANLTTPKAVKESTVKQRNITKMSSDAITAEVTSSIQDINISQPEIKKTKTEKAVAQVDPLKWFGVLVPQSLRLCQNNFKRATEISCKVASLKVKYSSLQQRYRDTKAKKVNLLNESLELGDY